jgi:hypothetical protein
MRKCLKDKTNDLARHSMTKNIRDLCRGINTFKKDYQPRNKLVKYEDDDLLEDSHIILNTRKNLLSHLLNVHKVSDVRQMEIHTPQPPGLDPDTISRSMHA